MGEFDEMCAKAVRLVKLKHPGNNIRLFFVCAYMKQSLNKNKIYFEQLYDEIIICADSEAAHYKSAVKIRNRRMVDLSSLLIAYVKKNFGGAYDTLRYAKKTKYKYNKP